MKIHRTRLALIAAAIAHLALVPILSAQIALYWDGDGAGMVGGGAGTWDTILPRWSTSPTGSTYQAWVNANTDDAVFTGTGALVTLSGPLTARSLDLQVPGYTFGGGSAGSITLMGSGFGTINLASGIGTMAANLAGTSGFTKTGAGTLVFTFNSTIAGNRRIEGGAVNIDSALRIANSGTVTLNGGALVQTNPSSNIPFLQTSTSLEVGAGGGTISYTGASGSFSTYAGTIRGPGNTLYKIGTGEFRYQGSGLPNTTYGKLAVLEGLFRLGAGTADERGFGAVPDSFLPDAITLDGGAIGTNFNLTVHQNRGMRLGPGGGTINTGGGTATFQAAITGAGGLSKTGTNPLRLTASSDFIGPFTLFDNRLEVHADNALGLGNLVFAVTGNGTLTNNGSGDVTLNNPIVNLQSGSIDISAANNVTLTLTGKLTGPANWKRHDGSGSTGTVVLSNSANDFTGALTITTGRVVITADNALGSPLGRTTVNTNASLGIRGGIDYLSPEPLTLNGSGILNLGALHSISGDNRFAGPITLAALSSIGVSSDTLELVGPIGGNFRLTKEGPGTLILSNAANSFGTLSIATGTVVVSSDGNLGAVGATPTVRLFMNDTSVLRATASFELHPNRSTIVVGSAAFDIAAGATLTYDGTINGDMLNKIGSGTLRLGGAHAYTGATNVHAGTLSLAATATLPTHVNIDPPGALHGRGAVSGDVHVNGTISPGDSIGTLPSTGNHTWGGGGTYVWEINDATGSPGVNWDQLTMNALSVTATSKNKFKVRVIALPGKGGPGLDNFDPNAPFSWVIAVASSGTVSNFDLEAFEIDVTQFEQNNSNKGGFYVSRSGGDLMLNYVPEPTSSALVLLGSAALLHRRRRTA